MNESDYKKTVLKAYRVRQEIRYVSRRTMLLMFAMWGAFVVAVGALFVCVYCAGLSELDSDKMLISGMAILTFTSVIYFILGKEMGKTRVRGI